MPASKISGLTELTTPASGDLLPIVDVSDTTQAATGTTKKIQRANLIPEFTPQSASTAGAISLYEDTDNGTNKVTLIAPASIASDRTLTLPDATDALVGKDTTDTLTNKTLTSPVLTTPKVTTSINDSNGNEVIKTPATASAVNEVTVTNAATGNAVQIGATGGDTDVALKLIGQGASKVYPQMAAAKVTCSSTTNTTTSADITGATVTFTPSVACYALIQMVADLSSSVAGDIATVDLKVDGVAETPQCIFTAPANGYRATVAQTYLITLTAASHTIKMTLNRASGTGTVTAQINQTGFTYLLISQ